MRAFENYGRYGVRSMAPMLASRFCMDAHACEAAAQAWAGFGLAELDPLPRDCKYFTEYARIRLLPVGQETDVLSASSASETDPQLCELSLFSDGEPEAKNSNGEPVDVPSVGGLVDIPMPVSFNAEEAHLLPFVRLVADTSSGQSLGAQRR